MPQNRTLSVVFFTIFLDLIGFGIIIPIQPFFAKSLGASPTVVTLIGAAFSLMQFLFTPFWGRLSDRIGRRPVMLMSIATNVVGYTLFAVSQNLFLLFFARMLAGFGSANIGAAQAIVADCTDHSERAKGMGKIGAAFGLGFIFGPALGAIFGQWGLSAPAYFAAFLCGVNFISAFLFLPETNTNKSIFTPDYSLFPMAVLKNAIQKPNVLRLFLMYLIFISAFSMVEQIIGLFVESVWLPNTAIEAARLAAYTLMSVGITATVVQGVLIGNLSKKFGEKKLLMAGTLVVAIVLSLLPELASYKNFALFLAFNILMAVGTGMVNPSFSSFLSKCSGRDDLGGVLGLGQSFAALGRVIGPTFAGILFELHTALPLWVASGFIVVCCFISSWLKPVKEEESQYEMVKMRAKM